MGSVESSESALYSSISQLAYGLPSTNVYFPSVLESFNSNVLHRRPSPIKETIQGSNCVHRQLVTLVRFVSYKFPSSVTNTL